jgi:CBS domain-containing protein
MTRDIKFMTHKDSIVECVIEMLNCNIGAFPIVDNDNNRKLIGIITERDFVLAMAGILTDELVEDFMTKKVITTTLGTPIEGSSKIMVRNKLRRIPVLGKEEKASYPEEKLVGIVTSNDILEFFADNKLFTKMESESGLDILNRKISEIMEKEVYTVEPSTRLGDLCKLLNEKDLGGVPVVKNNEMLGIITEQDVLKAIKTTSK